jgi:lipopolysaccharide assembly outer membrane protein LptD (OstA)
MPVIVNAPVFRADYAAKTLTFDEGVMGVMSDRSASFKVNHVVYNFTSQKLVGTGGARFTQGQYLATAQQIVVDAKAKRVRMSGGVRFERRG